jgi:predicted O-methyltransferase YrrM
VHFSNPAVDQVFAEYERRNTDERAMAADLGNKMFARRDEFLLPVGREVGWFLHSLILAKRPARVLELGTSYGYSTLFLADAVTKDLYVPCLRAVYPKLADEGIIAADNMIEPAVVREDVRKYRAAVGSLSDMQTMLLPIGSGIELSIKWSPANRKL